MKKHLMLCLTVLSLFFGTSVYAANYAIIVDAGSSGSRLHLFQYESGDKLPLINDIFSENVSTPLSSFANMPDEAGKSLKKLLDDATQKLLSIQVDPHTVSISVMGTAGMRLLPADKQQTIYANVARYLQTNYSFTTKTIATIPGKMEGVYGWLDVNYLANNFATPSDITKGALDMGGASTQITFSTQDTSKPDDLVTLTIAGKKYLVFSKTFLGMGQDQARAAISADATANTCYPINYAYTPGYSGNFNFASCSHLYAKFITKNGIAAALPPFQQREFFAFSGAYFTLNFFGVDKTPDQTTVEKRIQTVCSNSWEQLKKDYPNVADKYLSVYCANGIYTAKLYYDTYQLRGSQLTVTNKINEKDIDWTLGALLYQLTN